MEYLANGFAFLSYNTRLTQEVNLADHAMRKRDPEWVVEQQRFDDDFPY